MNNHLNNLFQPERVRKNPAGLTKYKNNNKMKKIIITLLVIIASVTTTNLLAQVPPPPPPGHGQSGNQPGGNAPIGGGLFILLGLGAAYGGKKLHDLRKESFEE